jgi:DNA-binding IclR family transcriptional regulator
MPSSSYVQSVIKALDILHAVSNTENGAGLNDLSEMFGMKKTTVHNLVRTLRARNYLTKDSGNRYQIGPAVNELLSGHHRNDIIRRAGEEMRKLHKKLPGYTLTFSELCGTEIYCRLRMSADQPGLLQKPVAMMFQPYNSATGICFQAFYEEYHYMVLERYPFNEFATRKWKNIKQFELLLDHVRKTGCYVDQGYKPGIRMTFPVGEYFVLGINIFDCKSGRIDKIKMEVVTAIDKIK